MTPPSAMGDHVSGPRHPVQAGEGGRLWTRAVALLASAGATAGLVIYNRAADPGVDVSWGWYVFLQSYVAVLAGCALFAGVAPSGRWRARSLEAATAGCFAFGILSILSIGIGLVAATVPLALAAEVESRRAGRDWLRPVVAIVTFAAPWVMLFAFPP